MLTEDYEQAQYLSSQVEQARQRAVLAASDSGASRDDARVAEQQAREHAKKAGLVVVNVDQAVQEAKDAADRAEAPTDAMVATLAGNPVSLTRAAVDQATGDMITTAGSTTQVAGDARWVTQTGADIVVASEIERTGSETQVSGDARWVTNAGADDMNKNLIEDPESLTNTALSAAIVEGVEDTAIQRTAEAFGTVGDGLTSDTVAISSMLNWATGDTGRRVVGTTGKHYRLTAPITLPAGSTEIDFQGATVDFATGATIASPAPTPYLTTTSTTGVTRKGTKLTVAAATGVAVGDLISIESPVEWVTGIPLQQYYLVSDVDTLTKEVWVEGRIVGDITPAQVTAAGKVGSIAVKFFRLQDRLVIRNATLRSSNRDAGDNMLNISGYRHVVYENVRIERPFRTGINTTLCGIVETINCTTTEHGYTSRDRGYASAPSDPSGQGFGYGFLASNCYLWHVQGCSSLSGWHGFDAARGLTYALFTDHTASKDAFGVSSHEGCWVLDVQGGRFLGGNAIASRSAELYVDGARIDTSLGVALNGHGSHHRLVLRNLTIDCAGSAAVPFAFTAGTFQAHHLSAEPSYAEISNVSVTGVGATSTVTVPGDLTVDGLLMGASTSGTQSTLTLTTGGMGKRLTVRNHGVRGTLGQSDLAVSKFATVDLIRPHRIGMVGVPSNSSLMTLTLDSGTAHVTVQGAVIEDLSFICRVLTGAATFDFLDCYAKNGTLLLATSGSTIKNAINNRTNTAALTVGGSTVTQSVGNVTLAA